LGNPVAFRLTAGYASDLEGADALLPDLSVGALLADRAYDADARCIEPTQRQETQIVIPSHPRRNVRGDYDRVLYNDGHLIEHFFAAKLKQYLPLPPDTTRRPATSSAPSTAAHRLFYLIDGRA